MTGLRRVNGSNSTARNTTGNTMRFGANYTANGLTGFVKMQQCWIYNRRITDTAEQDAIAAQIRAIATAVGITV